MTSQNKLISLKDIIAPSFYNMHWDIYEGKHTHYFIKGGRGSAKSSFVSVEIIICMTNNKDINAVVMRKTQSELRGSVYAQMIWAIEILGVSHKWHRSISPLALTNIDTGQKIVFRGMDDAKKSKSIKFERGYCGIVWYEEVDQFSGMEEIRMANQSLIRGGEKFIALYTYNPPKSASNWVNNEVQLTREDRLIHHSTYLTVPRQWLGEQFFIEAEHLKQTKPDNYAHEYLGEVTGTGGEVFTNVTCRPITDEEIKEFYNVKRGMDFGYAVDPFAYNTMHYDRKHKTLYIYHEIYKVGLSNKAAYDLVMQENKHNEMVTADSAEPKSINEFRQYGLRIRAVKKGPDSIEYGIKFLQDLEAIIIDDKRCPETAREFLNYELEKDANGNFKAGYPDKNNHTIDDVRYGLNDECMNFREETNKPKKRDDFFDRDKEDTYELTDSYINMGR